VIFSSVHFKFPLRILEKECFTFSPFKIGSAAFCIPMNYSNLKMSLLWMQTHTTNTRKPAFRWLGWRGKAWSESVDLGHNSNFNEPGKRKFGTDITNTSFKRSKTDFLLDGHTCKMQNQQENMSYRVQPERSNFEKDAKQTSKGYQFGPFAPAYVPKVGTSEDNSGNQVHDWDSLAQVHRPQYQNQGI